MKHELNIDKPKFILLEKYYSETIGVIIKKIYFFTIKEAENYLNAIDKNNIIYFGEYKPVKVVTKLEV